MRRSSNSIQRVQGEDGGMVESPEEIRSLFFDYFSKLLGGDLEDVGDSHIIVGSIPKLISEEDYATLTREITMSELATVVRNLPFYEAPGLDGMSGMFYKRFWHIVGSDVLRALQHFFRNCSMPRQ